MTRARRDLHLALVCAATLAAGQGIGRFAYTALLPAAQRGLGFDDRTAGLLASANLAGYLGGALLARSTPAVARTALFRLGLAAVVVTTALVGATTTAAGWAVVRAASGFASGLVFVFGASMALEAASDRQRVSGLIYSGVGAGIALSGLVSAIPALAGWRAPWLVLGALSVPLVVPAWIALPAHAPAAPPPEAPPAASPQRPEPRPVAASRLYASYFLEGLGYIVSGTFAVAAAQRIPAVAPYSAWVWVVAGVVGAPSAPLWTALGRRVGERAALVAAYAVQAAGMALPALSASAGAAILGAAFFGGTFMGITALTMSAMAKLSTARQARDIGTLTVLFGGGQVIGPALAGALSRRLGDPRPSVLAASVAVAICAAIVVFPEGARRRRASPEEEETCRT